MVSTLNELSQLKYSGFGQPQPRHGLNLLYWFVQDCIHFSNNYIVPIYMPQNGDFGFHRYHNRIEDDDDHIVPLQNLPYYEVGNLNARGAEKLPKYVRENYSQNDPDSNRDRVIVRQDASGNFNRVYVTEHNDPKRFDRSKTYRVSQGLLSIIKNMSREQFLKQTINIREEPLIYTQYNHNVPERAPDNDGSWCTIL
ncbi:interferon-inducible Gig1 [Labeo rohita]|uniref:Interferon-inducible Gig1 n=1 Tax=Labeo rohita TaxID=84645 RepID=A0A498LKZ2_LABRO|nr:interferon-inducible Gig1 [Labeo rohita]